MAVYIVERNLPGITMEQLADCSKSSNQKGAGIHC